MKKTMAILACCVVGLSACGGGSGEKSANKSGLNESGTKLAKMSLENDLRNSINGKNSMISQSDALNLINLHGKISSVALSKAYLANELAADEKYKNKTMIVNGKVQSIGKDVTDSPYLQLNGSGMFQMVNAYFDKKSAGELAKMSKNQNTTLVCHVKNYILGQVVLKDCKMLSSYLNEKIPAVSNNVPDVLAGKKSIGAGADTSIKLSYALSSRLPENSECRTSIESKKCGEEIKKIPKEEMDKIRAEAGF